MPVAKHSVGTFRAVAWLRQAPGTVPALAALVLFVIWATDQGGYPVTHWAPGGLIVLALLVLSLVAVGPTLLVDASMAVKIAVACLAAYTAFSFLSISWAAVPGDAWEGADRTLLYLLVFTLFACQRQRGGSALILLGAWALAMIGLAAFVVLHVDAATRSGLEGLLPEGRLVYPAGYVNANAAQWLMAFWPAVLLARGDRLPWALRGILAGGAVLLAEVALLGQSRGSVYATAVMIVLVFALLPGRVRTFAVLVPVVAGIGAAAPAVLHVHDRLQNGGDGRAAVHSAIAAMLVAAAAVALVVAIAAAVESRRAFSEGAARRVRRSVGAVAIFTLVAILAAGWALAGNPVARVRHGWDTFKGGYTSNSAGGDRLVSGLGSNRYDFYRVALDEFAAHPLAGTGADNFQQQYLRHGRSEETPRYPHSVELRTLAETGLVGALLALFGLAAALVASAPALRLAGREPDPLAATVAAAALGGFMYWLVHGSVDWLWEFAGLGAPAFALLGLACSLGSGRSKAGKEREPRRVHPRARRVGAALAGLAALAAAASLAGPWLSQLQIQAAARIWPRTPLKAYARLKEAAGLNPLSDQAYLVAGSIALRFDDLARAEGDFSLALGRTPGDAYATLELGAIASSKSERGRALGLLERAALLNPRDSLTREALQVARSGGRIDLEQLNRSILAKARQLA